MSIQISIGIFSKMTRLSKKALRIYDKKGILNAEREKFTGYRFYIPEQIETGIRIKMLIQIGFGLNQISDILKATEDGNESLIDELFSNKLNEIQNEIERLNLLENIIRNNKPMDLIYMNCSEPEIKQTPKIRVISKRQLGTYKLMIGKLIGELMKQIINNKANITGPIIFISHDDEYTEENADIEMLIPIKGKIAVDEEFEIKYLEEAMVVSVIHTGSYKDIGSAYTRCFNFVIKKNYEIVGKSREIYLNDPNKVDTKDLLTEIQIPVRI